MREWRPIPGFPNFEASSFGLVGAINGMILLPSPDSHGYPVVYIQNAVGKSVSIAVHRLVALAFHGPCPAGMEVNHKDGDKSNSAAANLEYVTHADNMRHAWATGLIKSPPVGNASYATKFTFEQVEQMRALRADGMKLREVGAKFGTSAAYVSAVCLGKQRVAA